MNSPSRFWSAIFALLLLAAMTSPNLPAAHGDARWKKVDEAMEKGLPQTAIEALAPILERALAEGRDGEAAMAIARKVALEGTIQGNKPEERITRMEAEIAKASPGVKPWLQTLQAVWFWHYFDRNRWRFLQRTATGESPGEDFTAWDLRRLFAEIDRRFSEALAGADALRATPVSSLDDLLDRGSLPDTYRPTAYDVIAHEALRFYTTSEQGLARPQDAFQIRAEDPIFDGLDAFLAWQPAATDTGAPALRALALYRELLRFHRADPDPTALLDVDLARLVFGNNSASGAARGDRFRAALRTLAESNSGHEISAMARHELARSLRESGDLVAAREAALPGARAFPKSAGGRLCHNLIGEIEARSLDIETEAVWNAPWPAISISYRNLSAVHFRAVAIDWERWTLGQERGTKSDRQLALLRERPALRWSSDLPPTPDYKSRSHEIPAPDSLAPGFYCLLASADPKFRESDNVVSCAEFWVSDLALVTRSRAGRMEGLVLEANSGEPVAGARIDSWRRDWRRGTVLGPKAETGADGVFALPPNQDGQLILRATSGGRSVSAEDSVNRGAPERERESLPLAFLFTDRALYRPGQTIRYKGIVVRVDQERDTYETVTGQRVALVFKDSNGKEIERARAATNDYGSFSGSFTAPRDRLMGEMTLAVEDGARGSTEIQVEEYKRPKFEVTLDAPAAAAALGEKVALAGKAESYAGAPIDGAQVKWRVTRQVRRPIWWFLFRSWGIDDDDESPQEIASGTTRTATDGSFPVEFVALPDPRAKEEDGAWFRFAISADVTDNAGETRSAERDVQVGFTSLEATLDADGWLTRERPAELRVRIATLDGKPQAAKGTVRIHRLQEPAQVSRPPLGQTARHRLWHATPPRPDDRPDPSDPNRWELGEVTAELPFATDAKGEQTLRAALAPGLYRAVLETSDPRGKKVAALKPLHVLDPDAPRFAAKIPQLVIAPTWSVETGQTLDALWGTGYDEGRALVEIEHRGQIVQRFWTEPGRTQQRVRVEVAETMRGGFQLHVTQIRENRAHIFSQPVHVPWSNKDLRLRWEHFTSKLQPGQQETWTLVIGAPAPGKDAPPAPGAVAELVATLYDESLDQFLPHSWHGGFPIFRRDRSDADPRFANSITSLDRILGSWDSRSVGTSFSYRALPDELVEDLWGYALQKGRRFAFARGAGAGDADGLGVMPPPMPMAAAPAMAEDAAPGDTMQLAASPEPAEKAKDQEHPAATGPRPDPGAVSARKNLDETAFFFPHLVSGESGETRISFAMPEALTRWKFLGFAHDRNCRAGLLVDHAVTSKDLMVQPNPPRFLREGDEIEFAVKVTNRTAERAAGRARLTFADARTGESADTALGNATPEVAFDIPGNESRGIAWRIRVPDGCGFLTYKATAATERVGDGEEGHLPVLPRRILVTESLPLPIRGPATRQFRFEKLLAAGGSDSLRHQSLVAQMVSNPAWYAVMSLPYLMEFPHECAEQTFNRLYANALARHIAGTDPKIRRVFDQWRGTGTLESPLEKNEDLKSVLLEETPWVRDADRESAARRNVGILFDANRLDAESARTLAKLAETQLPDGAWPWFPGGRGDDYITLYIAAGFGRLRHLGVAVDTAPALRALGRLDAWIAERHRDILRGDHPEKHVPTSVEALYLYARSFFLKDRPVARGDQGAAVEFFLRRSREFWLEVGSRQSQGHIALALHRFGGDENARAAADILRSMKERSVTDDELGRFWRETEASWWWYRAPIETQALMIEAFDEVARDADAVEECKVWLLKQKQTQDWKTTKATADAIYALLLRGADLLASDRLVDLSLGGAPVTPQPRPDGTAPAVEAGTGFFERRFGPGEIVPRLGEIEVRKGDPGVAWGSVHWQYLEDVGKVTPHEATPLKLRKTLHTKIDTPQGPTLQPVRGPVRVGDELVVRLELRVDREMEYVHLKDARGSGTEPVDVLSGYTFRDGLAYYRSTRDTATHFFIDRLPKGTYVLEYSTRVQLRGRYQTGLASIQCMYAPEFNSHSESVALEAR